ncbi:hypothetical protein AYI69_g7479 [Smittium culicis]|uniref:Uncharacterized protein n=1 Tax=Smittium culicis TaxID=133412 RepID=A0A1R1XRN3_9FUNG|nr:hypothetical protein AYI69_g7479 [Smittium culicis]
MELTNVSIPSSPLRTLVEPSYLHQGPQTSTNLGQNSNYTSIGILGQPTDNRGVQEEVFGEHRKSVFPVDQPGIQNQLGKVDHGTTPINNSLRGDNKTRYMSLEYSIKVEEQCVEEFEFMKISCDAEQAIDTDPEVLVVTAQEMIRAIISPGDTRNGAVYRYQLYGMGDNCGIPKLLSFVSSLDFTDPH